MSRLLRWFLVAVAVLVTAGIVVLDVATGVWAEVPVISGLASALVTFLLTVAVVDHVVASHTHKQWAPLTHMALADVLEEVTTGDGLTPRRFEVETHANPRVLLEAVVTERRRLGATLARWSEFLVANAGVDEVVEQAARVGGALEDIRAAVWPYAGLPEVPASERGELTEAIAAYDAATALFVELVDVALEVARLEAARTQVQPPTQRAHHRRGART